MKCASASACILALALMGSAGCAGIPFTKTVHERTCESVETVWDVDAQDILIIEHGCTMTQLEKHGFGFAEIASAIGGIIAIILSVLL
ncbi:hypothetical protein LCGC14_1973430 [marine sediment metagenome]|uniref:Lipoprotein n=1 Tax=marine sediment metagenome TaxID=412755 RepID=A0A0F9HPF4_9ZZZZ